MLKRHPYFIIKYITISILSSLLLKNQIFRKCPPQRTGTRNSRLLSCAQGWGGSVERIAAQARFLSTRWSRFCKRHRSVPNTTARVICERAESRLNRIHRWKLETGSCRNSVWNCIWNWWSRRSLYLPARLVGRIHRLRQQPSERALLQHLPILLVSLKVFAMDKVISNDSCFQVLMHPWAGWKSSSPGGNCRTSEQNVYINDPFGDIRPMIAQSQTGIIWVSKGDSMLNIVGEQKHIKFEAAKILPAYRISMESGRIF